MDILALLDPRGVVARIVTTDQPLSDFAMEAMDVTMDVPEIGQILDRETGLFADRVIYNTYSYVDFMEILMTYKVSARKLIQAKNGGGDLGADLELMFEMIRGMDGVDFASAVSRQRFYDLATAGIFEQAEVDAIVGGA